MFFVHWFRKYWRRIRTQRELAERSDKTKEVCWRMAQLYEQLFTHNMHMAPSAVIDALYAMHDYLEMPIYRYADDIWSKHDPQPMLYWLLGYLRVHPHFGTHDAIRVAQMLLWPETKRFVNDLSCRRVMLTICEQFPSKEIKEVVRRHFLFAQAQLEREQKGNPWKHDDGKGNVFLIPAGGPSSRLSRDLGLEIFRIQRLLAA